jgi:hypothetical protein
LISEQYIYKLEQIQIEPSFAGDYIEREGEGVIKGGVSTRSEKPTGLS